MKRRWMWILWPGFLVAIVAEVIVFALVDPHDVDALRELGFGPLAIYTLGFMFFWLLGAASSAMTTFLGDLG